MSFNTDSHEANILTKSGFNNPSKVANTPEGSIWKAQQPIVDNNNDFLISAKNRVIKISKINQDALKEVSIFKYLTKDNIAPNSIIKYIDCLQSTSKHYLIMEDGGCCLFDFVVKMHKLIAIKQLDITELHRITRIIMKQMIEAIDYIHSKNIAHMDISLENWLINDMEIKVDQFGKIHFPSDGGVHVKLCDFGLSEAFISNNNTKWKCNKFCGKYQYASPEITVKKHGFDAKSNDIFCLGVCLFMIMIGSTPWESASKNDAGFFCIINGHIKDVLNKWNKLSFVTDEVIELFNGFFRYEDDRITIRDLKRNKWIYQ